MKIINKEEKNKKYYDELMYVLSNYYIFKKRPKTRVYSLINLIFLFIISFLLLGIFFLFIPKFEYISLIFFTFFGIYIYLLIEAKYRLREYLKFGNSIIEINESGIENICENKMAVKLPWCAIEYVIINKYSICVLPKNFSSILIGIEISAKDDIYKALKKYKKLDLIIDNSDRYR